MYDGKNTARLGGTAIVLGRTKDQSAYCSELWGLLRMIHTIYNLCHYHKIQEGLITIACDNMSALEWSTDTTTTLSITRSDNDILCAIQHVLSKMPISWHSVHVRGHQDDTHNELTWLETLNCKMDNKAKEPYKNHQVVPVPTLVGEPWSIWIGGEKITNNVAKHLYCLVHCTAAHEYWKKKGKIQEANQINWELLGTAFTEMSPTMQRFISKHLSGMCGMGKFLQIWKEQYTAQCPRCDMLEDAPHVWRCPSQSVREIWLAALNDLEKWMLEVHADPVIAKTILQSIQTWLNLWQQEDQTYLPEELETLMHWQEDIGWGNFIEGFHHSAWQELQRDYYTKLQSRRTGKRWNVALLKKLWTTLYTCWTDTRLNINRDNRKTERTWASSTGNAEHSSTGYPKPALNKMPTYFAYHLRK